MSGGGALPLDSRAGSARTFRGQQLHSRCIDPRNPNPMLAYPAIAALPTTIFSVMSALAVEHKSVNLGQGFPDDEGPASMKDVASSRWAAARVGAPIGLEFRL